MSSPADDRWRMRPVLVPLLIALLFPGTTPASPAASPLRLGRGVNIMFVDPVWDGGRSRMRERHFRLIREAGFHSVRVNLRAFRHMNSEDRLPETWLRKLEWVVTAATESDLAVVIDLHDGAACATDATACRRRVLAFWKQIAPRFRNAPDTVAFELLNEPRGAITADVWNALLAQALAVVRTSNPRRAVVIGSAKSNRIDSLSQLKLPEIDRNLIVTVHYYDPFMFTHQGAPWSRRTREMSDVSWGTANDRSRLRAAFQRADQWARSTGRGLYLGEFGAYETAPMTSRAAYANAVAREAERREWSWAWWQFDSDFKLYDLSGDQWVEPLRAALIPP